MHLNISLTLTCLCSLIIVVNSLGMGYPHTKLFIHFLIIREKKNNIFMSVLQFCWPLLFYNSESRHVQRQLLVL